MPKIENVSLLDILPENLKRDEKVVALAKSLDVELKKLSAQTKLPLHLPRLNELDHPVLDELAFQYHVDFYEPEFQSLKTKRLLIKESIHEHRKIRDSFWNGETFKYTFKRFKSY